MVQQLATILGDELPLLKRDGGFLRDGASPNSTRCGRCAISRAG
jgi:hypothetical protein